MICSSLVGAEEQACTDPTLVGPFTVQVVEVSEATHVKAAEEMELPAGKRPQLSTMLGSEYFELTESEDSLPHAVLALRRYGREGMQMLEWDTVFEGGQLVLSEHQVAYQSEGESGEHLKTIWRERALGQGDAHTVIAETEGTGTWHVLRYGLKSKAHATVTRMVTEDSPVMTRLGLLQKVRTEGAASGPMAIWRGELGIWEQGQVHTVDLNQTASLQWMYPGLQASRVVLWRSTESPASLAFELNGSHCSGIQTSWRGPWARPMHEDRWMRLDSKWRREAPVNDPGAKARALEATAPFFDKTVHRVPTWHKM